ncbi:MAG: hypothetical protein SGJ19_18545 [Planctomycetia bacterium]|nr:hypothetical protein [Planctomycetia bacterium]
MRIPLFTLAALATFSSARADMVFEYRTAATITQQTPGTLIDPVVGLQLQPGGPDVFLQVVLKDTGTVGVPSPTNPVIVDSVNNRLFAWGFRLNFAQNAANQLIATGVQPLNDANNTRSGLTAFGFSDPIITNGSDAAPTASFAVLRDLTLDAGAYDPSNLYPLVNIRIHADALKAGTGSFSIVDTGPSDDIGTVNNPSFDVGIFDQAFVLPVTVANVPEPNTMVLGCLAATVLAVSALRRRTGRAVNPRGSGGKINLWDEEETPGCEDYAADLEHSQMGNGTFRL